MKARALGSELLRQSRIDRSCRVYVHVPGSTGRPLEVVNYEVIEWGAGPDLVILEVEEPLRAPTWAQAAPGQDFAGAGL